MERKSVHVNKEYTVGFLKLQAGFLSEKNQVVTKGGKIPSRFHHKRFQGFLQREMRKE